MYVTVTKGFDLQPPRLLLIIFSFFILKKLFFEGSKSLFKNIRYEKYLLAFYIVALISLAHHLGNEISAREMVITYSGWLVLPVFYVTLRETADPGMTKGILWAFIFLGIASTIVAVIQFFVLPGFLRYTFDRLAFAGRLRSNGLFGDEYVHSYFCIIASYASLLLVEKNTRKIGLLAVFAIGVFLSFHRMSYVVFTITMAIAFLFIPRKLSLASKGILVLGMICLLTFMVGILSEKLWKSNLVTQRLSTPISERIAFYDVAAKRIRTDWLFGVGSPNTAAYYSDAVSSGHAYAAMGEGGGIHDVYLYLAYFYGIPVSFLFAIFLAATFRFYWGQLRNNHIFYLLPAMTILLIILANLTNYFPPNTELSVYSAIIIGLSFSVWKNRFEDGIVL